MEQGRVAACHAFELGYKTAVSPLFPYGLYTIPEVATVGETEAQASARGEDVEVGRAWYKDNARGQIVGDLQGLLKLVFRAEDKRLLGVHVIGERATELVHVGQTAMALGGNIDHFVHQVFNFPSLGEMYKYAASDGLGRLARRGRAPGA
jgi:NAD(P) transhydrogenase